MTTNEGFLKQRVDECIQDRDFYRQLWLDAVKKAKLDVVATDGAKITVEEFDAEQAKLGGMPYGTYGGYGD